MKQELPPELRLPEIIPSSPAADLEFGIKCVRAALRRIQFEHETSVLLIDDEVLSWKLYSGEDFGGVYCADQRCDKLRCQGHNSSIYEGAWPSVDDSDPATITIAELLVLVREHIDGMRAWSSE